MKEKNNVYTIGALIVSGLGLAGGLYLCGFFSFIPALAQIDSDEVVMGAGIDNEPPEIPDASSVIFYVGGNPDPAAVDLVENSSSELNCRVTIGDANGCEDLDGATPTAYIYYSGAAGAPACAENGRDCYHADCTYVADSCTPGGSDAFADFICTPHVAGPDGIRYYAQPSIVSGDWKCHVIPEDEESAVGVGVTGDTPTEVNELLAFNVMGPDGTYPATDAIAYGTIALNEVSAQKTVVVTNTGNLSIDTDIYSVGVSPDYFRCTIGTFTTGMQNYSLTDDFTWYDFDADSSTVFYTSSTPKLMQLDQGVTTHSEDIAAGASTQNTYWKLKMPETGVSGSCNSELSFVVEEN